MIEISRIKGFTSLFVLFLSSSVYSYVLTAYKLDTLITIIFIFTLIFIYINLLKQESPNWVRLIVIYNGLLYFGLIIGFVLAGAPEKSIWMVDSYDMHLPGAKNVAMYLAGKEEMRELKGSFDKIYFIQVWTGIFFWFFGVKPWVSILAALPLKILTSLNIFWLSRKLNDERSAAISAFTYAFMPTLLFYTISFYKEVSIHFIISSIFLLNYKIFYEKSYYQIVLLSVLMLLIANERFYLFPMMGLMSLVFVILSKKISNFLKVIFLGVFVIFGILFAFRYSGAIEINRIFEILNVLKNGYNNYSDVNKVYNSELIYPLSFIKIIFTPFFTFNKFEIFFDYSYLLIWGAFLNQFVILVALSGYFKHLRKYWIYSIPFWLLIMLFAYVAPYNGRLRDSFYPIIVIWFASGLLYLEPLLIRILPKKTLEHRHKNDFYIKPE